MKLQRTLVALAIACSPAAFAETDGSLGGTSTGSTDVSITIDAFVRVLLEDDIQLGSATAGSDSSGSTGVCIYRNGDDDVEVTLSSANADGANFRLIDGSEYLPYAVTLTGSTTDVTAGSGTKFTVTDENNTSSTCSGGFSHNLAVNVLAADIDAAVAGDYEDTVTVLVEPL